MRPAGRGRVAPPLERYRSLARFYAADARRADSRELDVGLWWLEEAEGPLHRAAWVRATGELYLVRLGPCQDGGGEVEVLASLPDRQLLETALEGWRDRCGQPGSLEWLRERAAMAPRERAPRFTRSRGHLFDARDFALRPLS